MKRFIPVFLLALLPLCSGLNCYSCTGCSSGCNMPFQPTGEGVSMVGSDSYKYCAVTMIGGIATRYGAASCTETPLVSGTKTSCCQTDLCNGAVLPNAASTNYEKPMLLVISFAVIGASIRWILKD